MAAGTKGIHGFVFDLDGADAIVARLNGLSINLQRRVIAGAVNKAATPLVRAWRKAAPVSAHSRMVKGVLRQPGNLKKSTKKLLRRKTRLGPMGIVGHSWPQGAHAHLVQRGTKARFTKTGKYTGVMPSNKYATRATDSVKSTVLANLKELILQGIEKEVAKAR